MAVAISAESLQRIARISAYLDHEVSKRANPSWQHLLYIRTAKLAEEVGELMQAVIGCTGDNPRKGITHQLADVQSELCDSVLTALCALQHTTGSKAATARLLNDHIRNVEVRLATSKDYNEFTKHPPQRQRSQRYGIGAFAGDYPTAASGSARTTIQPHRMG